VMQLKNDYERGVFNGDVGTISRVEERGATMYVTYDEDREVAYDRTAQDELSLAYACSIHKSQGSEYPAVIVAMLKSHFVMLSRNLLYTGVTRGKRLVVLVTDSRALSVALARAVGDERRSQLSIRLRKAMGLDIWEQRTQDWS
jgi:exodeoxyribonuclease V alpha subunit